MSTRRQSPGGRRTEPPTRRRRPRLLVLGLGNPLLGDDGIGAAVVARLESKRLPARVELRAAGTSAIDVLSELERYERVVVIDAVQSGAVKPGHVVEFELESAAIKARSPSLSAHEVELGGLLSLAAALGLRMPPVHVIGFGAGSVGVGRGLTPAAEAALDDIVARVLRLCGAAPAAAAPAPPAAAPGVTNMIGGNRTVGTWPAK